MLIEKLGGIMNPIPSPGQGLFLPPGASTLLPSLPALRFDPHSLKLPTPTYSIPTLPVFEFDPINFKIPFPERYKPRVISPLEQKVTFVFLLTFVWMSTAFVVGAIAREKGFTKREETSMALIGGTAVTTLTYVNLPMGLASMAIIMLIGCFVCKSSLSSVGPREDLYRFKPINWPRPVQPINFQPIVRDEDFILLMRLYDGPFNLPNLRVDES
jgi:hypothetical protein